MFQIKTLKSYWPLVIILLVTALMLRTFVYPGVPATHDNNNHLARMANFYKALKDGHFPPRWAPNLNYQFGYPVFNYNYYLPYVPALPFFVLGFSLETSLKCSYFIFLLAGGIGLYFFLKEHLSKEAALAGAILYLTAPPQLLQIFVRGNIGEAAGWAMLPIGLLSIHKLIIAKKFNLLWWLASSFSVLLLLLSHNVVFLLGLPVLLAYGLMIGLSKKIQLIPFISALLLGLGFGAYFLIPAILETKFITLPQVALSKQFLGHFPNLSQLLYSPWGYGYSEVGSADTMSFQLGPIHLLLLIIGLGLLIFKFQKIKFNKLNLIIIFFIGIFLISVFLMLPVSSFFWKTFPFLQQIQFPWRLLVLTTLSLSILGGFIAEKLPKVFVYVVLGMVIVYGFFLAKPQSYLHQDDFMYIMFPFTSSVNHENMPLGFNMDKNAEYKTQLTDTKSKASFNVKKWKTQAHEYQIDSSENTTVIEHTAYFPGWEVWIDGQPVSIVSNNSEYPGMITYQVNKGTHQVKTVLTEHTSARKIGDIISLTSLVILIGVSGWILGRKIKES
ncbi:hypothetical protein GYA49_05285 [Candidatus Beckwithbacteria bacterium]|nr:hypothetical protein [Candidatus Beckwithbacteria bacterium]